MLMLELLWLAAPYQAVHCNSMLCIVFVAQKQYRSDLNWMKGVGWETAGSLDVQQAKKACNMASEVTPHPGNPKGCTRFTWFCIIVSQILSCK